MTKKQQRRFMAARVEWAAKRLADCVLGGCSGWPVTSKAETLRFLIEHDGAKRAA